MAMGLYHMRRQLCCWGLAGFLTAASLAPAVAQMRVKYNYSKVSGTSTVLTNVGNETFPDAAPAKVIQKKKSSSGASKTASKSSKSSASAKSSTTASAKSKASQAAEASRRAALASTQAPVGRTRVVHTKNLLKIHTVDDSILPAPGIEYGAPSYRYSGDTWAFANFSASKRSPRWVRVCGRYRDESGAITSGWHDVDLNPIILEASRDNGIDPLLVEIVIRYESNFNPEAVSPVGAYGLMQLMPYTANGLGVRDIRDVRDNIFAGVRYLAIQLNRFDSVPLALAAYNAGPGAVERYGGVPPYAETQYYVNAIYGEYLSGLRQREQSR